MRTNHTHIWPEMEHLQSFHEILLPKLGFLMNGHATAPRMLSAQNGGRGIITPGPGH